MKIDGSVHWFMEPIDEINYLNAAAHNIQGVVPGITIIKSERGTETLGFRVNQEGTFIDSIYFIISNLSGSCGISELEFHGSYKGLINPQTGTAEINFICLSEFFPGFRFLFNFNTKTVTLTIHKISDCNDCSTIWFSFTPTNLNNLNSEIPDKFYLNQNYPNPFNPTTNFEFQISDFGLVSLKVFDVLGNEVTTLINEEKSPGNYRIQFDASSLASGIYFYELKTEKFSSAKKMILVK